MRAIFYYIFQWKIPTFVFAGHFFKLVNIWSLSGWLSACSPSSGSQITTTKSLNIDQIPGVHWPKQMRWSLDLKKLWCLITRWRIMRLFGERFWSLKILGRILTITILLAKLKITWNVSIEKIGPVLEDICVNCVIQPMKWPFRNWPYTAYSTNIHVE